MAAGTRPILFSTPWTPPCSLWWTSSTSLTRLLAYITTWRWVLYASFEGYSVTSYHRGRMDHHPYRWRPRAGVGIGEVSSNPWKNKRVQASLRRDPASLCHTPIGLQTQREEAQGAGGRERRAPEEQGSSCTNSFSKRQTLPQALQKDLHMCSLGGKKNNRCLPGKSLLNISK